ncbi:MAG: chemotaxis protein CheW [Alphaproteobacteria bacterium]|nr:chemotaxis protein CheW [Alphaproteobacteria bacterium]
MDDLLQEFLTETAENLEVIDTELVRFESDPSNEATLNNIFRLVHTIKGTCGFLGLPRLEAVAHAGETLLGRFRDKALAVTPEAVTLVLRSIDRIKEILVGLEATGAEQPGDDSAIIEGLQAAAEGKLGAAPAPEPQAPAHPVGPNGERWDADLQRFLRPGEVSLAELEAAFQNTAVEPIAVAPAPKPPEPAVAPAAAAAPPKPVARFDEPEEDDAIAKGERGSAAQTIRVNVDVLEELMNTVSELVLTRNQLLQMVRGLNDSEFKAPLQRLSNITADLQDRVMKTRMQPVGSAWRKLPRIVRDICRETGKRIELRMEGEATELDRQVLELIKDPLTHMIRNSADHGIEPPETRISKGKPDTGVIRLAAHHEGGHIIILVQDDGAGLGTSRIREKAIEKGLVGAAEAAGMTDQQIQRFIFAPGFSTASKITNLSGRGVGMDVVKTNIEVIGGSIELQSVEGAGTTFRIKIPLTLAIVSALILGARGQRFAMPQTSVLELVRVGGGAEHKIDTINRTPVLRLREKLLPLLELGDALQLQPLPTTQERARYVVVMQVGATRFGVVVDDVHDTEEIVVKPLATLLRGVPRLSGATILGDGSVVVILDPNGLCEALGSAPETVDANAAAEIATVSSEGRQSLLLFRAGSGGVKAAPLMLITRLEETDATSIERADGRAVMKYRGALMPVIHAGGDHMFRTEGQQPVLVFSHGDQPFGLAVDEIVDIVHEDVTLDLAADRPGVIGAALVRGKATEMIDVGYYVEQATADWSQRNRAKKRGRVLLVEGSDFARTMLTPLIQAAGYEIAAAPTPDDAWRLHEAGARFDAILADVDANPAAAATFAEQVAADAVWSGAARIALSGSGGQAPQFDDCVRKTDRSQLLAALDYAVTAKRSWGNAA